MSTIYLYLIRHGETVDNVAQLYAGRRDSILTNHGHLQAERLGEYFHKRSVIFTHIFSSTLKRAYKTADLIRAAQDGPVVVQSPSLMEQDFGSREGVSWKSKFADASAKDGSDMQPAAADAFVPAETKEAMDRRADAFIDEYVSPMFLANVSQTCVIALVSHGIILGRLWKRLLSRMPHKGVRIAPELTASRDIIALEHLGRWDNTGYLKLRWSQQPVKTSTTPTETTQPQSYTDQPPDESLVSDNSDLLRSIESNGTWELLVEAINGRDHLQGLKRTRGGVGSSGHDDKQKDIKSFFKKVRTC